MGDPVEVSLDPAQREIMLSCSPEMFSKICHVVLQETGPIEGLAGELPNIRLLVIGEKVEASVPKSHVTERIGLLGCGIVATAFLFVFAVGIGTILGWLR